MRKFFITLLILVLGFLTSCTDNYKARHLGGTETITLPKGQLLIAATWKETSLWYLTEPMPEGYVPRTKIFQEKSGAGLIEGTIVFIETK